MPEVEYPAPAGPLPGYLAVPESEGPWPGYLALAPALFRRGFRPRCVVSTLRTLSRGDGVAVDDVVAARGYLAADARCTGKVGSVGFCMGGGFCLLLAPAGSSPPPHRITVSCLMTRRTRTCGSRARWWPATARGIACSPVRPPGSSRS